MEGFLIELVGKFPVVSIVLLSLGSLVVIAQTVVFITPSKKDDEVLDMIEKHPIFGSIVSVLSKFAVIQKKK
jgi:hypothetical protein